MRFLAALSASCKRLLEWFARQIYKCNLSLCCSEMKEGFVETPQPKPSCEAA